VEKPAMAVVIAIAIPLVIFGILVVVFYQINKRTRIFQNPRWLPWLYVVFVVFYTAVAWLNFVVHSSWWPVLIYAAVSATFAGILLLSATNSRRWRQYMRMWSSETSLGYGVRWFIG
jgi:uncharacterized integral membrane protein